MARQRDPASLVEALRGGDRGALARALSVIERGGPDAREVGRLAFPHGGRAYTVGITGAPGSGKSTLTSALITGLRAASVEVAVLAIDPSSPFTGGAILGDRVRMQDHALDDGVFIRSMATRGHLGGLALATPQAVRVLDAAGAPWVLLETVGVGQVEVEVAGAADTTVVVVNPGWGDAVQANKAGLLEVADVFVINKADRDGVGETRRDLESMLEMSHHEGWRPPIIATVAAAEDRAGVDELWQAVTDHRAHLEASGGLRARRARRLDDELRAIVVHRLEEEALARTTGSDFDRLHAAVLERRVDPYTAANELLGEIVAD
ncbi:MAG TPA: methylmalonyl Co-A mutase-associated GTPase MeaB [Acidimicrobiales bacterium]|nr:methylmalonyl Co-A mutase-associated GTPase MeaB [Acidimicrobiales bacterium]